MLTGAPFLEQVPNKSETVRGLVTKLKQTNRGKELLFQAAPAAPPPTTDTGSTPGLEVPVNGGGWVPEWLQREREARASNRAPSTLSQTR